MKVCSLYGAGFYYVPGTDICLKIGAYFRAEYASATWRRSLTNLDAIGADGQRTRITGPDYQQRARAFVFLDSRQQTAYGTLRAYMNIGAPSDFPASASAPARRRVYANRAFIQLAGFTWGLATSYYDFFSSPATSYSVPWSSDTGDGGWKVAAYTAQLGNGLSASLSLRRAAPPGHHQQQRLRHCARLRHIRSALFRFRTSRRFSGLTSWPTSALTRLGARADHGRDPQVGGGYYGTTFGNAVPAPCRLASSAPCGNTCSGHPEDKIGFAVGAGIKVNFPMIGPGDYFQAQVNYTEGASRYAALTPAARRPRHLRQTARDRLRRRLVQRRRVLRHQLRAAAANGRPARPAVQVST